MAESDPRLEAMTDEDRAYRGARYRDVVDAIFANPYQRVWGGPGEPPLPVYPVTLAGVLAGALPFGRGHAFAQASARAVDSAADLRWGPDRRGYHRLLHPNGVCLTGRWRITDETPYSGYFRRGSEALVVARYSPCCTETRRGHTRSLSLVGKLFPTTDPGHSELLQTANFITQEDIGGADTVSINAAELRNAPDVTLSRRGGGVAVLLTTAVVFGRVDREPTIRQLYPIAELGKPANEPTRAPAFMRLLVRGDQPVVSGEELDVRDEVMGHIFDPGDPAPKRTLGFTIELTDEGETSGPASKLRRTFRNWRRVGELVFDNAVISWNGDSVIHFNHPTWRSDRNDPSTGTRVGERKVS
jgi:hypothetical protein